jgi:hypothetical protein
MKGIIIIRRESGREVEIRSKEQDKVVARLRDTSQIKMKTSQ